MWGVSEYIPVHCQELRINGSTCLFSRVYRFFCFRLQGSTWSTRIFKGVTEDSNARHYGSTDLHVFFRGCIDFLASVFNDLWIYVDFQRCHRRQQCQALHVFFRGYIRFFGFRLQGSTDLCGFSKVSLKTAVPGTKYQRLYRVFQKEWHLIVKSPRLCHSVFLFVIPLKFFLTA